MSSTEILDNPVVTLDDEAFDILVAEDDPVAQELISSIFEVASWPSPVFACDGAEALSHLQEKHWDILISDLNMPRLGGEELIRRARLLHTDLTILVITGNGTIDRAVALMRGGAFDFITKPYSVEVFLASLRKAKDRVRERYEIRGMREVVGALLVALESKDRYLQGHASRVSRFGLALAPEFARLDPARPHVVPDFAVAEFGLEVGEAQVLACLAAERQLQDSSAVAEPRRHQVVAVRHSAHVDAEERRAQQVRTGGGGGGARILANGDRLLKVDE